MDKIKINLDKQTFNKLLDDINLFHYTKKDSVINKNGFINTLIKNHFPTFDSAASKCINNYHSIVNTHLDNKFICNKIINDLISSDNLFSFNKSSPLESSFSFKPSNCNKSIIETVIYKYGPYQTISSFFRNLILDYLVLPQYKREQIIFSNNYELITEAIESQRKIIVHSNQKRHIVSPYKIVTNKEELYNYLICLKHEKDSVTIMSFHLFKIDYVGLLQETVSITEDDKAKLENVASFYPQFPFYKDSYSVVELSDTGVKMFESKYFNRPTPYKIENNLYYFNCSYNQLSLYFFPFGKNAKIISPSNLISSFKKMYQEAYNLYS